MLGPKYALKKTCLSCNASPFDESYASPGHNGKKSCFLPRGIEGQDTRLFSAAPSLLCATFGPVKALGTSQLTAMSIFSFVAARIWYDQGLAAVRIVRALSSRRKRAVQYYERLEGGLA